MKLFLKYFHQTLITAYHEIRCCGKCETKQICHDYSFRLKHLRNFPPAHCSHSQLQVSSRNSNSQKGGPVKLFVPYTKAKRKRRDGEGSVSKRLSTSGEDGLKGIYIYILFLLFGTFLVIRLFAWWKNSLNIYG